MPSWNIPALVNKISEDVPAIKGLLTALFKWTDADTTDVPVGAKRLQAVAGGKQMQEYSGSAWASIGKLMHDVDMLDGKHASTAQTADTIPVRDANGTIPGNISGNAATATTASSLASDYTVPIANGGTGATTAANARSALGANNASNISSGILGVAYGGTGSSQKNFVDLTNNQNVGGTKTFSSTIKSSTTTFLNGVVTGVSNTDTTRGQRSTINLVEVLDKDNKLFASVQAEANTDGSRSIYFLMKNRANNDWPMDLKLKELADGTVQTLAKTPPAAANDTQIATTAWGNSKFVQKAGDTMTGQLVINKSNSANGGGLKLTGDGQNFAINICDTAVTKGTAPASQRYCGIEWYGNDNSNYNKRLGMIEFGLSTANISSAFLRAYNCTTATNTGTCSISCNVDASGNAYTSAPTPANNDRSTKIATTAYIGNCVVPAGTRMVFQQSAAPTGWTKETGSGYNNTALRFVTGNVANRTNGTAFSTIFAAGRATTGATQGGTISNATQGGTISKTTAGGTVGNKALSVAMLASHKHALPAHDYGSGGGDQVMYTVNHAKKSRFSSDNTGSGSNHNHSFTGSEHGHTFTGSSHGHTFTGSSHSHKIDMNVNYIDCIIAKKA